MIKDLGGRVASVWETLRPVTKKMLVGEMRSEPSAPRTSDPQYDAHADWELSSLLFALDELSVSKDLKNDANKMSEMSKLAAVCVRMLETQSASAEIFIQLASRAVRNNDYARLDRLADRLAERYSASEIAEIIRQSDSPQIRALAYETLAMLPVSTLEPLLNDSLYGEIAINALSQKAYEFDSEEANAALERMRFDSFGTEGPNN
ncbi:MAG: hypothetical protein DYH05_04655 [Acidobacteria bacterium ACB1]|nr:hypothetical protein [Pyrinomonadaceae bacterium]MCE7961773.1 hypothetical protein [Acidobacteria bacterium ACB1]RIJ94327.1 MAG: hypothetical protein DCC44_04835 [Acidobacteriota bacterium]